MPGGEDADDVIVLDSSSNDDDCVAIDGKCEQVLFKKTFGIEGKKKARHKRFASSESSDGNEERHSRPDSSAAANFEVDDDADFVIDTETAAPKFSEDDDVVLDTNSTKRRDEEWPDAPNGDSISLNSVLTTDSTIASLKEGDGRPKRRAIECFNCGGPHIIGKCPEPRDHARIARAMRQQRMNRTPDVGRYHDAGDAELASRFRAGIVSPDLADALGLRRNELPEWIYRMRKLGFIKGYPPGYLKQAIVSEREAVNDILQFHCDQPDGDLHSTDELAPRVSRIEPNKVIYYFGFNKAARDNIRDREASWYSVPSFEAFVDIHQEELNRQQERAERAARHKRHHQGDDQPQSSPSKKLKREPTVVDMDVSSDDEPTTSGGLLPPPPLPPTEYDALTEEELEQLLAKKRLEMANMEEIGSPEPEEDDRDEAANDAPTLIPTDDGDRAITPPSVERRFVRHASSRSLDVMVGTPLGAPPSSHLKPSLDDFSKGIVPFSVNEEAPDAHKGFFKRIMAKLKGVANKKLKSPKTHGDADPQGAVRLDKRKGASRQRKKKN